MDTELCPHKEKYTLNKIFYSKSFDWKNSNKKNVLSSDLKMDFYFWIFAAFKRKKIEFNWVDRISKCESCTKIKRVPCEGLIKESSVQGSRIASFDCMVKFVIE